MKRPNLRNPILAVLLAVTLPYLLALLIAGRDWVFVGFLLNPMDGATYLAKMYQGWSGSWRFLLPFTAEPGQGAYLYLYYLFLGHLARWLGLPLIIVFHIMRLLGTGALLAALVAFYDQVFRERPDLYRLAFWLTVVGAGMGWLIVLQVLPADFWIAEAYPFLSMFSTPHFPLGLALLLAIFRGLLAAQTLRTHLLLIGAGLLLSIILPFGEVVAVLVAILWAGWTWQATGCLHWRPVVSVGLLGGPFLLYQFWVAQTDPVLASWNAQSVTLSPVWWNFILSFSPGLVLAVLGVAVLWKSVRKPAHPSESQPASLPALRLLIVWLVMGLVLVYFPVYLQRRFMLGLYIPVAALAIFGLDALCKRYPLRARLFVRGLFWLALPTNVLFLLILMIGVYQRAPQLYLTHDEALVLQWLDVNSPARSLVLASPETGIFIPAATGRRVLYGHRCETANAPQEEKTVIDFYQQQGSISAADAVLRGRKVNYLWYGPRERALGGNLDLSALPLVFETGDVQLYLVEK